MAAQSQAGGPPAFVTMTEAVPQYPIARPRRLRRTAAMRRFVRETDLSGRRLVQPLFYKEGLATPTPVATMPGVSQLDLDSLRRAAAQAAAAGVGGVMLFAIPAQRDDCGTAAVAPEGPLNVAVRAVVEEVGGDLLVMADVCLDEFTDHGHCGVLTEAGEVDNDATLAHYGQMAVLLAEAGVDVASPSGMMDGQVAAIRAALDGAGHQDVAILAYAAKYASAFYGPFREAVDSTLTGDRRTYQQDPGNRREARREVLLDLAEGADMVMVKPALGYLDVLSDVAREALVPVLAYQVSGEYSMVEAAAERGWLDRRSVVLETLGSIRRAGADGILTYWATEAAGWLAAEA
ncbi:MAG: porphobilinogen synthase [Actinomycetota bacterium]|nr:porphobilinogen synthase [Actinomycetota bacterium]